MGRASLVTPAVKNPPAMQKTRVQPELGRSPGEVNGNPLQYSCLRKPMDRAAWWATVQRAAKESDIPPNSHVEALTSKCEEYLFGGGDLGRWLDLDEVVRMEPQDEVSDLIRRGETRVVRVGTQQEGGCLQTRVGAPTRNWIHWQFRLSASKTVRNNICCLSYPCMCMLSHFSRVWLCGTHACACQVTSVVSNSVRPCGLQPVRFRYPWASPGKNTGVGWHFLSRASSLPRVRILVSYISCIGRQVPYY